MYENIKQKFKLYFQHSIEIEEKMDPITHKRYLQIKCIYNSENSECFSIKYNTNENIMEISALKYPRDKAIHCKYSGTDILVRIYLVGKELNVQQIIIHADGSEFSLPNVDPNKSDKQFYYYSFNILLYGESWYNRFGYHSNEYKEEIKDNSIIINKPLDEFGKDRQIQKIKKMLIDIGKNDLFTLRDIAVYLKNEFIMKYEAIITNTDLYSKLVLLLEYVTYYGFMYFNYNGENLRLDMNDASTIKLYEGTNGLINKYYQELSMTNKKSLKKQIKKSKSIRKSLIKSLSLKRSRKRQSIRRNQSI